MGYAPEIYEEAEKTLELKRIRSERELEKRRSILYSREPRAEVIEQTIARTAVAAAKAVFGGADLREQVEALRKKNLSLQKELAGIIRGFGFPENYLEQWFDCPACKDTGFIDGKMCSCMKRLLRQKAFDSLNRMTPLALSDFDSFSLDYYSRTPPSEGKSSHYEHMTRVLSFCRKYALSFSESSHSLLFQGAPGLGKTHLSLAIAREVIDKGYGVVYVSAPAILSRIESEHFDLRNPDNPSEKLVSDCDLLIIDDLGTEFTSRFTISSVYNIINTRMITNKPTIISTNLSLTELQEKYNSRIISRIIGMLDRVEFVGQDIRQQMRRRGSQNPSRKNP